MDRYSNSILEILKDFDGSTSFYQFAMAQSGVGMSTLYTYAKRYKHLLGENYLAKGYTKSEQPELTLSQMCYKLEKLTTKNSELLKDFVVSKDQNTKEIARLKGTLAKLHLAQNDVTEKFTDFQNRVNSLLDNSFETTQKQLHTCNRRVIIMFFGWGVLLLLLLIAKSGS